MTKVDPVIEKFLKDLWKNIDNKDFVNFYSEDITALGMYDILLYGHMRMGSE